MPEGVIDLQRVDFAKAKMLIDEYSYTPEMAMALVISDLIRTVPASYTISQFALDLKALAKKNEYARALWNMINRELEAGFQGHTNGLSNKQFILDTLGNIHSPSRHAGL